MLSPSTFSEWHSSSHSYSLNSTALGLCILYLETFCAHETITLHTSTMQIIIIDSQDQREDKYIRRFLLVNVPISTKLYLNYKLFKTQRSESSTFFFFSQRRVQSRQQVKPSQKYILQYQKSLHSRLLSILRFLKPKEGWYSGARRYGRCHTLLLTSSLSWCFLVFTLSSIRMYSFIQPIQDYTLCAIYLLSPGITMGNKKEKILVLMVLDIIVRKDNKIK